MSSATNKPAVLNISHNYHIAGGSDRYFFELGKLLETKEHKVIPFCAEDPKNAESAYDNYFPATINATNPTARDALKYIYSRDAKRCIKRILNDTSPDIAHLHIYYGKLTGSILRPLKSRGIPTVQTLHEYKLLCPVYDCMSNGTICEECNGREFWRCSVKRCNRGSFSRSVVSSIEAYTSLWLGSVDTIDHFIGVSQFMTNKMIQIGIAKEKISTIYNFIDTQATTPATASGDYVLYFGRLERTKGVFTLLEAMRKSPAIKLKIAGTGDAAIAMREIVESGNMKNVEFLGFVAGTELQDLIRGSLCTIMPSEWYENCPMAVLESLALGVPVVGARIGGIPELILDGEDGLLYEMGNSDLLAEALDYMSANFERSHEMGMAGRRKVERDFSAELHYQKINRLYRKLLNKES